MGPTNTGKTSLAIELAKKLDAEIISVDSVQIYKHANIGSNKPKSNILDYQNHIKSILSLKVILEKSIDNKKLATNNYSNSKPLIFN